MYNFSKILFVGVCIFAILHLHAADAKPATRNRRFVGDDIDEPLEDVDSNELYDRDARRVPSPSDDRTYPPFPEEDNWWFQELPSTTWSPPVTSESSYRYGYEDDDNTEKPRGDFHKKILPWFHRQWGKTKGFFKKHYETAANSLG